MVFSKVSYAFMAITIFIVSGIYSIFCYIGFDAKPIFDEMLAKWKLDKQNKTESDVETTYFSGFISGLLNLVFIFIAVLASVSILKTVATNKILKLDDFVDILVACLISVFIAVGLTMAAVRMLPIMGRAFENTVGYFGISNFGSLEEITSKILSNSSGSQIKYGVLSTKIFDSGFFAYLDKMKTAETTQVKGIFLNKDMLDFSGELKTDATDENPIYQWFKLTHMKHTISEATWISLATIIALFSGFNMIQYSGIKLKI